MRETRSSDADSGREEGGGEGEAEEETVVVAVLSSMASGRWGSSEM
jgi:hypothetical protein